MKDSDKYDDIIHLPHPDSPKRLRMPLQDRAAQFSPFAALTGYEEAIQEAARGTERRMELDEEHQSILNDKMRMIKERIREQPEITVTYFVPDVWKSGGAYIDVTGRVKRLEEYDRIMVLTDGTRIDFDQIFEIDGEIFPSMDLE